MRPLLPFHLGPRIRAKLEQVPAWIVFGFSMRRAGGRRELWIGDSHAMSFNRDIGLGMVMRAPAGQVVVRAGTRLMFSLGRKGFPARVTRAAAVAERWGRPDAFVPFFCAGEIDVRAHLAARPDDDLGFVRDYVRQCRDLAARLRSSVFVLVVPPPPSGWEADQVEYPVVGTLPERLAAFARLRDALRREVAAVPGGVLLDASEALADDRGALREAFTDDGCHTNAVAVPVVRDAVAQLGLSRAR